MQADFNTAVAEMTVYQSEFRVQRADGQLRWFASQGEPICNEAGTVERMVGIMQDITKRREAEAALHESQERMQQALQVSRSFAFEWEPATDNVIRSQSCAAILGLSGEDISIDTGQRYFQRIHPDDRERFTGILKQLNPAQAQYQTQYRLVRPDGGVVILEENGRGQFDAAGKLTRLIGCATDVTTREQAALALRENEEQQLQLMALLPVAVYMIKAPSGEITYYNEQAAKLWGRRPALGESDERFCGSFRLWLPDGTPLPHNQTPMTQVMSEGRTLRNLQVVIERPDSSRITALVNIAPILNQDGHIVGAVNVFQDVTALHEAEEALLEQKRLLQAITDNADTALFIMDDRQQCVFMNPAAEKLSGYRFEKTQGRALHEVVHHTRPDGSPYPLSECPIDQAFPQNDREQGEEIFVHKDGHFYPVAFTASPLRHENGQPVGAIIEVQDITERKQAENNLQEPNQRFRNMADTAPVLIWETDASGVVFVNGHYLDFFGVGLEAITGMGWANFLHPDDKDGYLQTYQQAYAAQTPYHYECRFLRNDGQYRWLRNVGRPLSE